MEVVLFYWREQWKNTQKHQMESLCGDETINEAPLIMLRET